MEITQQPTLGSLVRHTVILAHREDTTLLENALRAEGLDPFVQRKSNYSPLETTYSSSIRCLMNHADAWRRAASASGHTLVVEADFVPCRGFCGLPAPFDPAIHGPLAWAFLYAGGPRIFRVLPGGYLWGHSCCSVAMLISPEVAPHLADFADELIRTTEDLRAYSLWDTIFQWHMMGHQARCFVPYRQYGEHGGLPNPEHRNSGSGILAGSRFFRLLGLGGNHHAECLWGPLMFLPAYARGSRLRYYRTRLTAKLVGLARLFLGRVVEPTQAMSPTERVHALWTAIRRLASPY